MSLVYVRCGSVVFFRFLFGVTGRAILAGVDLSAKVASHEANHDYYLLDNFGAVPKRYVTITGYYD